MKQFVFSFSTDGRTWEEMIEASGMFDALNKVKLRKKQLGADVQLKLVGINYLQSA